MITSFNELQRLKIKNRDFPGGPWAKTPSSQCRCPSSIPEQGTRSQMLQPRVHMTQLGTLCAASETRGSQINNVKTKERSKGNYLGKEEVMLPLFCRQHNYI